MIPWGGGGEELPVVRESRRAETGLSTLLPFPRQVRHLSQGVSERERKVRSITIVETVTQIDGEEETNPLCLVVILSSSK